MPWPLGKAMVDINDFNLFDLVGLGDATGLEWIFGISALLGGILFLLWFILMLVGGVAEGVFEGLFGIEIDVMSSDASFKALTFQGVMAFMMFFGLAGLWVLKSDGTDPVAVAQAELQAQHPCMGQQNCLSYLSPCNHQETWR